MIKMWEKYPEFWKTESAFMSFVRSGIRKGLWEKHRVKLGFLEDSVELVVNTNPRSKKRFPKVKKWKCAICGDMFGTNDVEVDHMEGNHSLKTMDDLQTFVTSMIVVTKEELQIVCKPCHKIKSYAEKEGLSFEDAKVVKQVIQIIKDKKDKEAIKSYGEIPESNAEKRRAQLIRLMKEKQ